MLELAYLGYLMKLLIRVMGSVYLASLHAKPPCKLSMQTSDFNFEQPKRPTGEVSENNATLSLSRSKVFTRFLNSYEF